MAKAGIQQQYGLFINGEFVPASDGAAFDAHNPANGEHLAYFAEATKEDVDAAVKEQEQLFRNGPRLLQSKDRTFF